MMSAKIIYGALSMAKKAPIEKKYKRQTDTLMAQLGLNSIAEISPDILWSNKPYQK